MKYNESDVAILLDALRELAPRDVVADLALTRWNETAGRRRKGTRIYGVEHRWSVVPVGYVHEPGKFCGPNGCPIWECGLCGCQRIAGGPKWRPDAESLWMRRGRPQACPARTSESAP